MQSELNMSWGENSVNSWKNSHKSKKKRGGELGEITHKIEKYWYDLLHQKNLPKKEIKWKTKNFHHSKQKKNKIIFIMISRQTHTNNDIALFSNSRALSISGRQQHGFFPLRILRFSNFDPLECTFRNFAIYLSTYTHTYI